MAESKIQQDVYLINKLVTEFTFEAEKVGNKAAARRARKCSLQIQKMLKDFRKNSLK